MADIDNGDGDGDDNERILELLLAFSTNKAKEKKENKEEEEEEKEKEKENSDAICTLWDLAAASPANAYFMLECKAIPLLMGTALNVEGYSREVCLGAISAVISSLLSSAEASHNQGGKMLCRTKEIAQLCVFVALSDTDTPTLCEVCRIALHCLSALEESQNLWIELFHGEKVLDKIVFWIQNTYDTQLIVCASKLAYTLSYYDTRGKDNTMKCLCDAGLCGAAVEVLEENIARLDPISEAVGPLLSFLLMATESGQDTKFISAKAREILKRIKNIVHGDPEFEEDEKILDDLLALLVHTVKDK